ncbi:BLUF domain-containing protein [Microbacterium sp. 1.5R]|uniref:BLUF domain-containing protein n=1 Tax=Microbacterium sp. 1.5R TaxID=1916917 RepID=UPI0011A4DDE4|nr:BLUF domain-containing protein [Microbacterium sp. 1.5R]
MTGEDTGLRALVYTSNASQPFSEGALGQLLDECRQNNADAAVTGMLLYRDGRFIQVLEGEGDVVRGLAERIRRDPRHRDMRVLLEERLARRRFPDWTMGYRALRRDDESVPTGYRDSFSDLDADADDDTARRALAELTLWFRVRSARSVEV